MLSGINKILQMGFFSQVWLFGILALFCLIIYYGLLAPVNSDSSAYDTGTAIANGGLAIVTAISAYFAYLKGTKQKFNTRDFASLMILILVISLLFVIFQKDLVARLNYTATAILFILFGFMLFKEYLELQSSS